MKPAMIIVFLAAVTLCGCADDKDLDRSDSMALDSESCRAAAASGIDAHGVSSDQTAEEKREIYVKSYRDCMTAKGYALAGGPD
jgi:hypothetical protein